MDQQKVPDVKEHVTGFRSPHGKLSSLTYLRRALMEDAETTPDQKQVFNDKIDEEYRQIMNDHTHILSYELCCLRHTLWKAKHGGKDSGGLGITHRDVFVEDPSMEDV